MAFIQCNYYSENIGMQTEMNVIIPETPADRDKNILYPTLYLLHGLTDNNSMWLRKTSVERYASDKGLAIVVPTFHRSFYTNTNYGLNYWDLISKEIITFSRKMFPLSSAREDTFAAGLSMGGYGSLKLGLKCPEKFAAIASLSAVTDIPEILKKSIIEEENQKELISLFGNLETFSYDENDLFTILKNNLKAKKSLPRIFQCCGTEDFLHSQNIKFRDFCIKNNVDLTYKESKGEHTWKFWDEYIQKIINWLPIKKPFKILD